MGQEDKQQRVPLIHKNNTQSTSEDGERYEYDPSFKGVKESGRGCHDILFAVLFALVLAAMGAVSVMGFIKGDPERLVPSSEWDLKAEHKAEYWFQDAVAVMKRDTDILAGGIGFAFILAVCWVSLMRFFTKIFIYLTMILGFLSIIAVGVYFVKIGHEKGSTSLNITAYVLFGIAGLLILAIVLLRKKIAFTAALFAETCKGFQHNPAILVIGIIIFIAMAAFMAFWVAQFVYLYSIPGETIAIPDAPPKFNQKVRNLMYFQVFALFWVTSFMTAVYQVVIAGGMATWYFSRDLNGPNGGSPAFRSFGRALSFSFGSLAFGSLLLASVQFVNFVLTMTKKVNRTNKVVVFIISCIQCLLSCVQRLIKFVNQFAYIYIAMHGENFCTSAKNCFNLVSRNMFTAVIVDLFGEFVLLVGKLLGTALVTLFTVGICHHVGRPISPVTVTIAAFFAYRIFALFAKIVHVGVDTIMVCYLEDLERNREGALYMTPDLHRMLQAKVHENTSKGINA